VDREAPVPPLTDELLDRVLATFVGEQTQIPPMHSALKPRGVSGCTNWLVAVSQSSELRA